MTHLISAARSAAQLLVVGTPLFPERALLPPVQSPLHPVGEVLLSARCVAVAEMALAEYAL